jgi:Lon protease-like protein
MVPLHIFEPRYKQLLSDAETKDISFGIFFNHVANAEKIGSLVKLESVIKRDPQGESDIIVKCLDLFTMNKLYRSFRDKSYPGGEVTFWNIDIDQPVGARLQNAFKEYLLYFQIRTSETSHSLFTIANEINLDFDARLKFVLSDEEQKENFLLSQLKYKTQLLYQAEKAKDVFHLN